MEEGAEISAPSFLNLEYSAIMDKNFCDIQELEDGSIKLDFDLTTEQASVIKRAYGAEELSEEVLLKFVCDSIERYAQSQPE